MLMRTFPLPNFLEAKRQPCLILFAFQKICWSAVDGHDSTLHKVVENSSKSFHVSMFQRHACLPWMMCRCRQPQFYTSNQGCPSFPCLIDKDRRGPCKNQQPQPRQPSKRNHTKVPIQQRISYMTNFRVTILDKGVPFQHIFNY